MTITTELVGKLGGGLTWETVDTHIDMPKSGARATVWSRVAEEGTLYIVSASGSFSNVSSQANMAIYMDGRPIGSVDTRADGVLTLPVFGLGGSVEIAVYQTYNGSFSSDVRVKVAELYYAELPSF